MTQQFHLYNVPQRSVENLLLSKVPLLKVHLDQLKICKDRTYYLPCMQIQHQALHSNNFNLKALPLVKVNPKTIFFACTLLVPDGTPLISAP